MNGYLSGWKRWLAAGLCAAMLLSLAGCQENPKGSIVVHKDMDNLISKAQQDDSSKVGAADIVDEVAEHFETYQTTIEDKSLGVTVNVNAKVDVPQVDQLSVYRVRQKKIDQDLLDKVRKELLGDTPLYESARARRRTKAEIEQEIADMRQSIEDMAARMREDGCSEEDIQRNRDAYQYDIDLLQEAYEAAPTEINFADYPSDGLLHSVTDLYNAYPDSYEYYYYLNSTGDVLNAISDGSDGNYAVFYAQNDEDKSNKITCMTSRTGYMNVGGVMVGGGMLDTNAYGESKIHNNTVPDNFLSKGLGYDENTVFERCDGDELTTTHEEAVAQAENLLEKLGIEGFSLAEGDVYGEYMMIDSQLPSGAAPYRVNHILRFQRNIDGVLLTQASGAKFNDDRREDGSYSKRLWPGEGIDIRVNDSGIIGFDLYAPIEITETVVEGAALKSFSEVKDTFEKMVTVANADEERIVWINIDRVRLSYSRISEKDSFDTGLIVPVWSFEGKIDSAYKADENYVEQWNSGTIMAINAIDGSIIDAALGY